MTPVVWPERTFGDGHDDQRHRDDQNVHERDALLVRRARRVVRAELDEEPDHERDEQREAGDAAQRRDELGEVVELELQGRVFRLATERWRNEDKNRSAVCPHVDA